MVLSLKGYVFFVFVLFSSVGFSEENAPRKDFGKSVYEANCLSCHGPEGKGDGKVAKYINGTKPRNFKADPFKFGNSPQQIFNTITKGIKPNMPSWQVLSIEERNAVVQYVLKLKGDKTENQK